MYKWTLPDINVAEIIFEEKQNLQKKLDSSNPRQLKHKTKPHIPCVDLSVKLQKTKDQRGDYKGSRGQGDAHCFSEDPQLRLKGDFPIVEEITS